MAEEANKPCHRGQEGHSSLPKGNAEPPKGFKQEGELILFEFRNGWRWLGGAARGGQGSG